MNTKRQIILRGDSNSEIGTGHMFRLIALGEILKNDFKITFVTKRDSFIELIPDEFQTVILSKNISLLGEIEFIAKEFNKNSVIIIDGYQYSSDYQKGIKKFGFGLVYIDDLVEEYMFADIVINHSPAVVKSEYRSMPYTKFLLGPSYALVRPGFIKASLKERAQEDMKGCFVNFGGVDKYNLSVKILKALIAINFFEKIDVLIGAANENKELFEIQKHHNNISIYKNLNEAELINLMEKNQCAIVPASTIFLELCCIKMPILAGYFVENQKKPLEAFHAEQLCLNLGDLMKTNIIELSNKISDHLKTLTPNKIGEMISKQQSAFNGNQKTKFVDEICKI